MSAQPQAAGAAYGDWKIVDGGAEESGGGIAEGKDDEPGPAASGVQMSQAAFVVPDGFKRLSGDTRNSSIIYNFGVRVEATKPVPKNQARDGRYYCMGSAACRRAEHKFIRIKSNNTAAATTHLKALHGVSSKRRDAMAVKRKKHLETKWIQARNSKLCKDDFKRYVQVLYVKSHHVLGMEPFNYMENDERRHTLLVAGDEDNPFPVKKLNSKAVKDTIIDMYSATKVAFTEAAARLKSVTHGPFLHINVDLWTARGAAAKDQYLGVRAFLMKEDGSIITQLLAVKPYRPGEEVSDERAGECIRLWAGQALEEWGFGWEHVLGAVTDSGSDVKFAFGNTPGIFREWCIPHVLNRAIIDGFGLSLSPATSTNPESRGLFGDMRKDIEHVHESRKGNAEFIEMLDTAHETVPRGRLAQSVAHRWVSAAQAMERYLVFYPDLIAFSQKDGRQLAMSDKQELLELYSLMKEVTLVIESCQSTSVPSAPSALQHIVALLELLHPSKPLLLHDPEHLFIHPKMRAQGESAKTRRVRKKPEDLTDLAKATRAKLHAAIFKRFGANRYGKKYEEESHLFDMAVAFNPAMREHGYIDRLAESASLAVKVKEKIWLQIARLAEMVIISKRAKEQVASGATGSKRHQATDRDGEDMRNASIKRLKINPEVNEAVMSTFESAGLFDKPATKPVRASERAQTSAIEEAKGLVKDWREAQIPVEYSRITQGQTMAAFWRGYGAKHFPTLANVARAVLAAPGSAAVLERDFGEEAGELVNRQRGSLDPSFVEMLLFLRGAYDLIPEDVPALSAPERGEAIPARLRDPHKMEEVEDLTSGLATARADVPLGSFLVGGDLSDDEVGGS